MVEHHPTPHERRLGILRSQTLKNWKNMDAPEIHPRRINAKEALMPQRGEYFIFPVADGAAKLSGRDHEFREPTQMREQPVGSEDLSGEVQGEPELPKPTETKDDADDGNDFWSIQGDFIYRHRNEPRGQLYVPKEETFPIPLKYIGVTGLLVHVFQEKRIHDYWNVDANRSLSDSWKGFTKFTLWKEKPPNGHTWSGGRLTKIQGTTRPCEFVA